MCIRFVFLLMTRFVTRETICAGTATSSAAARRPGSARDLAWTNSLLLWEVRTNHIACGLLCDSLAAALG
jgi:hypothetical protein